MLGLIFLMILLIGIVVWVLRSINTPTYNGNPQKDKEMQEKTRKHTIGLYKQRIENGVKLDDADWQWMEENDKENITGWRESTRVNFKHRVDNKG